MKPILFNTDMVRAILAGRKMVTRRLVRCKGWEITGRPKWGEKIGQELFWFNVENEHTYTSITLKPPYHPGDILYVRETFSDELGKYIYKADGAKLHDGMCWHPSIHMPREAARIFLRVTDVLVERLLDMSRDDAVSEGCDSSLKDIAPDLGYYRIWGEMESIWNSTIKKADRAHYGWAANPWVWVIEFERISREEASDG